MLCKCVCNFFIALIMSFFYVKQICFHPGECLRLKRLSSWLPLDQLKKQVKFCLGTFASVLCEKHLCKIAWWCLGMKYGCLLPQC